jgi:hypothetical protein
MSRGTTTMDYHDVIRKQGEESRARQEALNARHDKIIQELQAADPDWWINYPLGRSITATVLAFYRTDDNEERNRLTNVKLGMMRETVAAYIIPAMYACVRAGFVKPSED